MINMMQQQQNQPQYPNIYGFVTPQKHYFKFVDGDYNMNTTIDMGGITIVSPDPNAVQWIGDKIPDHMLPEPVSTIPAGELTLTTPDPNAVQWIGDKIPDSMLPVPAVCTWNFETELGKTIKEKYESKYVKVVEVKNVVNRKPLPTNWLTTSPEDASVFEAANANSDIFPPWNTEIYNEIDLDVSGSFSHFVLPPKKETPPRPKYRNHWLQIIEEREWQEKKEQEQKKNWVLDV